MNPPLRHRSLRCLAAAAGLATLAACGGSTDAPGGSASTTTADRPPRTLPPATVPAGLGVVVSFAIVTAPTCAAGRSIEATATYETRDASRVAFLVDQGEVVPGEPPVSGSFVVPLPCDGAVHTVVLTATAPDGRSSLQSRAVSSPEPSGP